MPRLTKRIPTYRKHRATGQAVVILSGRDFYLGPHGTKTSKLEYDRLVAEWLQQGRNLPAEYRDDELSVAEVILAYLDHAAGHYVKNGKPTSEVDEIKLALRPVRELYGRHSASEFGPSRLEVVREKMISGGATRNTINQRIHKVRRCFKWAASKELIDSAIPVRLGMVEGLRRGRSAATESAPIEPIDDGTIDATIPHLPAVVADMVRLQRATGMRPGEVCELRPCDLDRRGEVWIYRPASHKTEHHGRGRLVAIGSRGQAILLKYLARDEQMHCFRPVDSEAKRRAELHEARTTPIQYGNRPGSCRVARPARPAGEQYTSNSYRRAIHRACDLAFPAGGDLARLDGETQRQWELRLQTTGHLEELRDWQTDHRWSPNRVRKTMATEVRQRFGLEYAQVVLGHAHASTSEIYARADLEKGLRVAREIG